MADRPAPEVRVDEGLVRRLLQSQHPDLASQPLRLLDRGWDNTNFRLGDDLIVRLPHRRAAAELIANEQRWLPELAPRLPIPIPAPVRSGHCQDGYPWSWSITPWFPGDVAARAPLVDPAADAARLGEFFAALHQPGPADAPTNPYRGHPVDALRRRFFDNLAKLDASIDSAALATVFETACDAPASSERRWMHGDLHTRNMIVADGRLAAVIDWGDICAGDPACDLAGALMLVPDHLDVVAATAGATEPTWQRARGWAAHFAVIYLLFGDDDPVMAGIGRNLVNALLA